MLTPTGDSMDEKARSRGTLRGEATFLLWSLKEAERTRLLKILESVQGNRARGVELLGISLRGLHYKLKEP